MVCDHEAGEKAPFVTFVVCSMLNVPCNVL